jgi:BirA family transcriptional regulator, biotin operon repressor / biotin---[acetyl-CoA-carboxylase] ligase
MIDAVRLMRETFVARVEYRPTVDSTNVRAAQCAAHGASELPLLVVADEQTAGRGRGGNRWWTGPQSLAFSLLLDAESVAADAERSPLVALAAAVVVVDAVAPLLPECQVGICWPNDVYVRTSDENAAKDRKLSGILVEVLPDRRHVIGIGLNVNDSAADAPAELRDKLTTLRDLAGRQFDRTDVLVALLRRLADEFSQLRDDPANVARRADSLCFERNRQVTIQWSNRQISGLCRGIAADGGILVETPSGVQSFVSGSVVAKH